MNKCLPVGIHYPRTIPAKLRHPTPFPLWGCFPQSHFLALCWLLRDQHTHFSVPHSCHPPALFPGVPPPPHLTQVWLRSGSVCLNDPHPSFLSLKINKAISRPRKPSTWRNVQPRHFQCHKGVLCVPDLPLESIRDQTSVARCGDTSL